MCEKIVCYFRDLNFVFAPARSIFMFGVGPDPDYWCVSGLVEGSFSTLRVQFLSEFRFFCVNRCNICMCKFFCHFCEFCLFFVPAKSTFVVLRVKPLPFGLVVHRFCSSVARFCPRF